MKNLSLSLLLLVFMLGNASLLVAQANPKTKRLLDEAMSAVGTDPGRAYNLAEDAFMMAEESKDDSSLMVATYIMGNANAQQGNYTDALRDFNNALSLSSKLKLDNMTGTLRSSLASLCMAQGDYSDAVVHAQQTLETYQKTGNRRGIANSYNVLGNANSSLGNARLALEYYGKALAIYKALNRPDGVLTMKNNIGDLLYQQGEYDEAMITFQQVLEARMKSPDTVAVAVAYVNMGLVLAKKEKFAEALEYQLRALKIYEGIDSQKDIALSYKDVADAYLGLRDLLKAKSFYEKARSLNESLSSKDGIAATYVGLGEYSIQAGKYEDARRNLFQAEGIFRAIEDRTALMNVFRLLGKSYLLEKNYANAMGSYLEALKVAEGMNSTRAAMEFYKSIVNACTAANDTALAASYKVKYDAAVEQHKQLGDLAAEARKILEQ